MALLTNDGPGDPEDGDFGRVLAEARTATADLALITDAAQVILWASASFTAMTGYEQTDLVGRNCRVLQGPGTDQTTRRQMRNDLTSGEAFEGSILNYRKDGSAFWAQMKITPLRLGEDSDITHFVSVQRDISNKVALMRQLEYQALHDHTTGLPNRVAAEQAVDRAVMRSPRRDTIVAVALIDLDDFRRINNTFGHAAGDAVLQQWATRMLSRLQEGDVLARMGGDEFVLILRHVHRADVSASLTRTLDHIHGAVEDPFHLDDQQAFIGMSMGIALVPDDGTDSRSILRSADEALYSAKRRPALDPAWWETAEYAHAHPLPVSPGEEAAGTPDHNGTAVQEDHRRALRGGGVVVHYQPVVDLRNGRVHLFEALARIRLPDQRLVYPDEFLRHFGVEDQRALFTTVLDQALGVLAVWDRAGLHHDVSVNLPPEILQEATVPALVQGLLWAHGISPERLGLELLESQGMSLETQRIALQELVDLGVGLAMDDLGSGHSSLQRLSSFPFNALKLDRGLFSHVHDKPLETLSIMATLVQMGRDLRMNVVIEGLEDEGLTEAATILGAPLGQGYFLARPMTPEHCLTWLGTAEPIPRPASIRTYLGALAYHWQFARLAASHPVDTESCPFGRFVGGVGAGSDVESWHELQHLPQSSHSTSSRSLIDWLTHQIVSGKPRDRRAATEAAPR